MSTISNKNFGAYMERALRLTKLRYLQAFKEMNIDITTEQWVLLDTLSQNDGITQTELANNSFKDTPTISRIVDLLCKKGWTIREKDQEDKRKYKIFLTKKGKDIYKLILPKVTALRQVGWKNLSVEDYQTYLRIMNQIFDNFSEEF